MRTEVPDEKGVRGRFAPTPSGYLHLGNVFTALCAFVQARAQGGQFILRIEDVDSPRCRPSYTTQILEDLLWLGFDWDEGPDVGGSHGPYLQSECGPIYRKAMDSLTQRGYLYPCFCSRSALASVASAPHGLTSQGPAYPGTCRHLSAADAARLAKRKKPALRFRVPERALEIEDQMHGLVRFPEGFGGDFVVSRADGVVAYQLAVVVDDARQGITDVVRGEDLLDSTARQVWLYEALGLPVPRFAHVPIVHGPDGRRLQKRDKSVAVVDMAKRGVASERIIGCLAYLAGWTKARTPLSPTDVLDLVHPDAPLPRAASITLDAESMEWMSR